MVASLSKAVICSFIWVCMKKGTIVAGDIECFEHFSDNGLTGIIPFKLKLVNDYAECVDYCISHYPYCKAAVISNVKKLREKLCDLYGSEKFDGRGYLASRQGSDTFIAIDPCLRKLHGGLLEEATGPSGQNNSQSEAASNRIHLLESQEMRDTLLQEMQEIHVRHLKMYESMDEESLKIPGLWLPWSDWKKCSVKCGPGVISRTRTCWKCQGREVQIEEQMHLCHGQLCEKDYQRSHGLPPYLQVEASDKREGHGLVEKRGPIRDQYDGSETPPYAEPDSDPTIAGPPLPSSYTEQELYVPAQKSSASIGKSSILNVPEAAGTTGATTTNLEHGNHESADVPKIYPKDLYTDNSHHGNRKESEATLITVTPTKAHSKVKFQPITYTRPMELKQDQHESYVIPYGIPYGTSRNFLGMTYTRPMELEQDQHGSYGIPYGIPYGTSKNFHGLPVAVTFDGQPKLKQKPSSLQHQKYDQILHPRTLLGKYPNSLGKANADFDILLEEPAVLSGASSEEYLTYQGNATNFVQQPYAFMHGIPSKGQMIVNGPFSSKDNKSLNRVGKPPDSRQKYPSPVPELIATDIKSPYKPIFETFVTPTSLRAADPRHYERFGPKIVFPSETINQAKPVDLLRSAENHSANPNAAYSSELSRNQDDHPYPSFSSSADAVNNGAVSEENYNDGYLDGVHSLYNLPKENQFTTRRRKPEFTTRGESIYPPESPAVIPDEVFNEDYPPKDLSNNGYLDGVQSLYNLPKEHYPPESPAVIPDAILNENYPPKELSNVSPQLNSYDVYGETQQTYSTYIPIGHKITELLPLEYSSKPDKTVDPTYQLPDDHNDQHDYLYEPSNGAISPPVSSHKTGAGYIHGNIYQLEATKAMPIPPTLDEATRSHYPPGARISNSHENLGYTDASNSVYEEPSMNGLEPFADNLTDYQNELSSFDSLPDYSEVSWSHWSDWTPCNIGVICKSIKQRLRSCNGIGCIGSPDEIQACDCFAQWFQWGQWSSCSADCGTGVTQRTRECSQTGKCLGEHLENQLCHADLECALWSEWSTWSACTAPCGLGQKIRQRTCNGFGQCIGQDTEQLFCMDHSCIPSDWSEWSPWLQCNATCGQGTQLRKRICEINLQGSPCHGSLEEYRACTGTECWADWNHWSICSSSCGHGERTRHRVCLSDTGCQDDSQAIEPCNSGVCPMWADWESWGSCSATCGRGVKTRVRKCHSSSKYGCRGPFVEENSCFIQPCPEVSPWGNWGLCSSTCGLGRRHRHRKCTEPNCSGLITIYEDCNMGQCPVWSGWSPWSLCTVTCGQGKAFRERTCQGGTVCEGHSLEHLECMESSCLTFVDCVWSFWEPWSICSASCGMGVRTRERLCLCNGQVGKGCLDGSSMQALLCQDVIVCDFN